MENSICLIFNLFQIVNINSSTSDLVYVEIERWEKGHIDVESFNKKVADVEKENISLKEKIALLERRVHVNNSSVVLICQLRFD